MIKDGENMKIQRKGSIFIAVFVGVIISNSAFAWDDEVTHPALTEKAINQLKDNWFAPYLENNLGFKDNVREELPYNNKQMSILNILKEGSREEDAWPDKKNKDTMRSINHFHSPIDNKGLHGEQYIYIFGIRKYIKLNGHSALGWAKGTGEGCTDTVTWACEDNQYSWISARESYRDAFEALRHNEHATWESKMALTFRSLGQVMHLIQDMAVPAHTRDDFWRGAGRVSAA
jgi:hypothetical protein